MSAAKTSAGFAIQWHVARWLFPAITLAWTTLIWVWQSSYLVLTVDDAFYYQRIAVHVSRGQGPTFDGINPTDGFHPGWLVLLTILSGILGDDPAVLMRATLTTQIALIAGGAWLLARSSAYGRQNVLPLVGLSLCHFHVARMLVNGQESALQFMLLAAALAAWWRKTARSPGGAFLLGTLAGLVGLVRLEATIFGVLLALMPVLWPPAEVAHRSLRWRLRLTVAMSAGLSVCLVPYLAHHFISTGHLIPVSGVVKAQAPAALGWPLRVGLATAALSIPAAIFFGRRRLLSSPERQELVRSIFPLLGYCGIQTAYLIGVQGTVILKLWYLAPHLMLLILMVAALGDVARAPKCMCSPWLLALRRLRIPLFWCPVASLLAASWAYRSQPRCYAKAAIARDLALWLNENVADPAIIGAWDAGVLGAHSRWPVVNLDGLANSWEYKLNYMDKGRIEQFVTQDQPMTHLVHYFEPRRLRVPGGPAYVGVSLSGFHVAQARCFELGDAFNPTRSSRLVYLVLSRAPTGRPMSAFVAELPQFCPD